MTGPAIDRGEWERGERMMEIWAIQTKLSVPVEGWYLSAAGGGGCSDYLL